MKALTPLSITLVLAAQAAAGEVTSTPASSNPGVPWPATDALSRRVPSGRETRGPRADRFVGIFYFEWLVSGMPIPRAPEGNGPYNVSAILARDSKAGASAASPPWGRVGEYHFWGEPLFGYYRSDDPWVVRRHLHLLADAGIDVLILDATNAETYRTVYTTLCAEAARIRASGGRAPKLTFMLNTNARQTARTLFKEFYEPGLSRDMWFQWEGKPLLICDPKETDDDLKAFFTLRRAHWPFTMVNTPYAWHWEATYPQPYGYTTDPKTPEQVNVSVAQNLSAKDGQVANMSSGQARGRSFHSGSQSITNGSVIHGFNFQEQWERALELDAPFVMVTGWNEWIAGRWGKPEEPPLFVDQDDQEFSRDIEPMRGGHGDNYYYQLVANVRRYKGAAPIPRASTPKSMRVKRGFEAWRDVAPEFLDHAGETEPRAFAGVGGMSYTNTTGRNDFLTLKVARDRQQVFFYVQTAEAITPARGSNWMWLLIDADQNAATGWAGYDFIVNRAVDASGRHWLERNTGGWNWERVSAVELKVEGRELQLAIPRRALGLRTGTTQTRLDFKWADNLQRAGDVMDFYLSGDAAPEGRFNYRYEAD